MHKLYRFFFFIFLIAISLSGCFDFPGDVIMPKWDVDLNVPLTNKTYLLDEIINTSNYVSIDTPNGFLYMVTSDNFEHVVPVKDFIKATDPSVSRNHGVTTDNQTKDVYLEFPEGAKIKAAKFKEGKIMLSLHNPSSLGSATVHFKFPGIKYGGTTLEFDLTAQANSTVSVEKDIKDHIYAQPFNQGLSKEGLFWIQCTGSSPISDLGSVLFDCITTGFEFDQVTGYLRGPKVLGHKEQSFALDLGTDAPKYRDKVKLKEAELTLKGEYQSEINDPFSVILRHVKLTGKRNTGASIVLNFTEGDSITFNNKSFTKHYNQDNSNILNFVEFMPDTVILSADYVMNPENNHEYKTALCTDSIKFDAYFQAKNILAIKSSTMEDTLDIDFKSDDRTTIANGQAASINFQIENSIPIDVWVKVTLADTNIHDLFVVTGTTGTGNDTILVKAATVDNNGIVTPGITTSSITLTADQIKKFSTAYFAKLSVTVQTSGYNDTNPSKYPIRATDWIKVKTYGSVKYRVQDNKK